MMAAVVGVLVGMVPSPAAANEPSRASTSAPVTYRVTFAARVCDGFEQVSAARVRSDRAEAPRQPGRDSPYAPGQAVDPQVESAAQPGCRPLPGVAFTLGTGRSRGTPLSVVTEPFATKIVTRETTPLLDARGQPTGGTLAGATTISLTAAQRAAAQSRGRLWAQPGTPKDPLPGGGQLAFATLRCAADQRDGANVAWVGFPAQVRHVFCVAYYVTGASVATGTVVVQAALTRPVGYPQPLRLRTDLTYAPDGAARLIVPGGAATLPSRGSGSEVRFTRLATAPGGVPYSMAAEPPSGWTVASLTCTPALGSGVGVSGAAATIALAAGDTVTCTYLLSPPPVTGLVLRAVAEEGAGTFTFAVRGPASADLVATTGPPGEPVYAAGANLTALPAGTYTVSQTLPAEGAWRLASVTCDGQTMPVSGLTATIEIPTAGAPRDCVFRSVRRQGSLTLRLATADAAGAGVFVVAGGSAGLTPVGGFGLTATTPDGSTPTSASGDLPTTLPLGEYDVTAVPALATVSGSWRLTGLSCDEGPGSPAVGLDGPAALTVALTPERPSRTCTASYALLAATQLRLVWSMPDGAAGSTAATGQVLDVACADGASGRLIRAPGAVEAQLPRPLYFAAATTCDITAGQNAPAGLSVTVRTESRPVGDVPVASASPAGGGAAGETAVTGLPTHVTVDLSMAEVVVTVLDGPPAPTSAPPTVVAGGSFPVPPMALVGAGVVLAGAFLLLLVVVRARGQRRDPM
ncbi:hypothetical protein GCM10009682_06640 [Luedemannella flava]|uniref:SpaA-like prealbumin fold domain-containing protein n=2 Tax=Luedemannella flava TaxID=349316 RepID=A0ABN2LFX6_9ACTN